MSETPRRRFLKQSVVAISTAGLTACSEIVREPQGDAGSRTLSEETLRAVAGTVLPAGELKANGVEAVMKGFMRWSRDFEPVAELEHPYLDSSEIRYGPADPRPRWQSQLEALELEAGKEHSSTLARLDEGVRRRLIEKHIRGDRLDRLPGNPAEANHVAVALAAYYFGSPEANDLCHQAKIERLACRSIETAPLKPAPLA